MTKTFPVHPDAAIFPMMSKDDLASLVDCGQAAADFQKVDFV